MTTGDLIRYRTVHPRPDLVGSGEPAFEWVDRYGVVLSTRGFRPARPDGDHLVRVYFPASTRDFTGHDCGHIRTLRASKIAEVL